MFANIPAGKDLNFNADSIIRFNNRSESERPIPAQKILIKYSCEAIIFDYEGEQHHVESIVEASSRYEAMCSFMIARESSVEFLVDEVLIEIATILMDVRKTKRIRN